MAITLELPSDLEQGLSAEAARQGLPLTEYVLRILTTGRPAPSMPVTGAELVNYWQREGLLGSRSDVSDSQAQARKLREQAEHRIPE